VLTWQITGTEIKIRINYKDENQNSHKLPGQKLKFLQITRTKLKVLENMGFRNYEF
jgi:hypothetical protein